MNLPDGFLMDEGSAPEWFERAWSNPYLWVQKVVLLLNRYHFQEQEIGFYTLLMFEALATAALLDFDHLNHLDMPSIHRDLVAQTSGGALPPLLHGPYGRYRARLEDRTTGKEILTARFDWNEDRHAWMGTFQVSDDEMEAARIS